MNGAYLDVHMADVTDNVLMVIEHGQTCDAFGVHEQEGILQWAVSVDGHDNLCPKLELLQWAGIQGFCGGKILVVLPEEPHKA